MTDSKIWFCSDFHYGHANICYSTSSWANKDTTTRKFKSLEAMNDKIVENVNKCVKADDQLYCIGDWSMGGPENIYTFRSRLNCKTIYLIPGNHDKYIKKRKPLPNCSFAAEFDFAIIPEPPAVVFNDWRDELMQVTSDDLFIILPELTTIVINKQKFVLSHYPIEEWEDMDRGSIHLHGHCHAVLNSRETNTRYKRFDVGLDWSEFRPYSLEEILDLMKNREIKPHNS